MNYQHYVTQLNNVSDAQRNTYSTLHALCILESSKVLKKSLEYSELEAKLQELRLERLVSEGLKTKLLFWSVTAYYLSEYGSQTLRREREQLKQIHPLLKNAKEEEIERIIKSRGYSPEDYLVKKLLLFKHLNIPYGVFIKEQKLGDYICSLLKSKICKECKANAANSSDEDIFTDFLLIDLMSDGVLDFDATPQTGSSGGGIFNSGLFDFFDDDGFDD